MSKNPGIPTEEQEYAAKHFTLSNLALLDVTGGKDLNYAYIRANEIMYGETGSGIEQELNYWKKEVKKSKPGDYLANEWASSKTRWSI